MPLPRSRQICLADTPYYHCTSRCVRRAFLCGKDKLTGKSFEHRRQWVEDRLLFLSSVFAIDICAYAVMSNHTHVVLHVNQQQSRQWSNKDVLTRWHKLHRGTMLSQQYMNNQVTPLNNIETQTLKITIEIYRQRLSDISWYMRELNEPIARQANAEDNCTGHFWEGRFKSQALLDDYALAACMVYVDLNPIRAKTATTPETSEHTSIQRRIFSLQNNQQPSTLMPFVGNPKQQQPCGLTFELIDYLNLVDISGRYLNPQKRGVIKLSESPILQRLGLDQDSWLAGSHNFEAYFAVAAGQYETLKQCKRRKKTKSSSG